MKIKNIISAGIIAMTLISCSNDLQQADYRVIPLPKTISESAGNPFILSKNVTVTYPSSQADLAKEAKFLSEYLNEILGYQLKVEKVDETKKSSINLIVDPSLFTEENSYKIIVNEDNIKKLGFSCSKNCDFKLKLKNNRLYLFEQTRNECLDLGLPEIF